MVILGNIKYGRKVIHVINGLFGLRNLWVTDYMFFWATWRVFVSHVTCFSESSYVIFRVTLRPLPIRVTRFSESRYVNSKSHVACFSQSGYTFFWVRLHTIPPFPAIVILSFLRSIVGTIVLRSSNCRCRYFVLSDASFLPMVRKRPFYDRWPMFSSFPKGSLSGRFVPIHRLAPNDVSLMSRCCIVSFCGKKRSFFCTKLSFPGDEI